MAAYKKGTMSKPIKSTGLTIGSSIKIGEPISSTASQLPSIGQSYNKMIGGGSIGSFGGGGFGGGLQSMGSLEAASMRLADAASRREIAEKQAEKELEDEYSAKSSGYSSAKEMQRDIRGKRLEQEIETKKQKEDEEMKRQGYVKVGGKWVMPVRG